MVRDDPEAHVGLVALPVVGVGDFGNLVGDVHHGVHIEEGTHVLAHAGQPFQAHARVDVFIFHLLVVPFAVVDELGEDVVPDLDIAVAVAAHGAGGLAAAVLFAPVVVDLGTGTAGPGAMLPEVVLFSEAEDALSGDADVLVPDFKSLVIVQVNGGIETVLLQAHYLGQEFPAIGDGVLFKIVSEGEVAQHLEVGAVTVGFSNVLNVASADALLAGADPVPGGLLFPGKPGFHGGHAAVDEEQAGVVSGGDEGKAGQAEMALALKVAEEHLPQLVQAMIGV